MMCTQHGWRRCAPLLLIACGAGCGGGPRVVEVAGVLTYKDKPVHNAYVDFVPEGGRPSWGLTDADGRFKLDYDPQRQGALLGKHKVSVRPGPTHNLEREPGVKPAMNRDMVEFYDKYSAEKSKAEVTVDAATSDLRLKLD
jgi:hypothetical protein